MLSRQANPKTMPFASSDKDLSDTNRATGLALLIAEEIRQRQLSPGSMIGTKLELSRQFGVGPEVLGQAVWLLEQQGIAKMRRGNQGGLFVADPKLDSVAHALATFFEFINVPFADFYTIHDALDSLTFGYIARTLTLAQTDKLRSRLQAYLQDGDRSWQAIFLSFDIHWELVDNIENPILSLLYQANMLFSVDVLPLEGMDETELRVGIESHLHNSLKFVESLAAGDVHGANHFSFENRQNALTMLRDWQKNEEKLGNSSLEKNNGLWAEQWTGQRTLADKLARQILRDIRLRNWPEGLCLGRERELLKSYGVSRATFRQTVRLLEYYSAAKMVRGPKGGLVVTLPEAGKVVDTAVSYLKKVGIQRQHLQPLKIELLMVAVDFLCHKNSPNDLTDLEYCYGQIQQCQQENSAVPVATFLQLLVARTGNRVLQVYWSILSSIEESIPTASSHSGKQSTKSIAVTTLKVVMESAARSDRIRARRALLDYLRAESEWLGLSGL